MKTYLIWEGEIPKDWEGLPPLPEDPFECDKLQKGDTLQFSIDTNDGAESYTAKVSKVEFNFSWDGSQDTCAKINVSQWIFVTG